jgi:hypothetical protein
VKFFKVVLIRTLWQPLIILYKYCIGVTLKETYCEAIHPISLQVLSCRAPDIRNIEGPHIHLLRIVTQCVYSYMDRDSVPRRHVHLRLSERALNAGAGETSIEIIKYLAGPDQTE